MFSMARQTQTQVNRLVRFVQGPIPFYAMCEHHALPFQGNAFVGYVPGDQIFGISRLTRLECVFVRRFTVQERIGEQIADLLADALQPKGIAGYLEAEHPCRRVRGVEEDVSTARTVIRRGNYTDDPALRDDIFSLAGRS